MVDDPEATTLAAARALLGNFEDEEQGADGTYAFMLVGVCGGFFGGVASRRRGCLTTRTAALVPVGLTADGPDRAWSGIRPSGATYPLCLTDPRFEGSRDRSPPYGGFDQVRDKVGEARNYERHPLTRWMGGVPDWAPSESGTKARTMLSEPTSMICLITPDLDFSPRHLFFSSRQQQRYRNNTRVLSTAGGS